MKKIKLFVLAFAAIAASLSISSCNSSDEPKEEDPTPVAAATAYTLYVASDFANYVDVEATYKDQAGSTQTAILSTEKVTVMGKECRKITISWDFQKLPVSHTINFKFAKKADADVSETITVGHGSEILANVRYSNNKIEGLGTQLSIGSSVIKNEKLDDYIQRLNEKYGTQSFTVDAEGHIVE